MIVQIFEHDLTITERITPYRTHGTGLRQQNYTMQLYDRNYEDSSNIRSEIWIELS